MEFMDTDLQEAIERRKYPNLLRQAELKGTMQQILKGVSYMHSKWFMHRDLKTSNILCHKSTGRVALCDFGLARYFQDPPGKNLTQLVVTLHYRAPELLFGETRYTPAVDIWSVGCIFGELIRQEAIMQGQGELEYVGIFVFFFCSLLSSHRSQHTPQYCSDAWILHIQFLSSPFILKFCQSDCVTLFFLSFRRTKKKQ